MSSSPNEPVVFLGDRQGLYLRHLERGDLHRCRVWINSPEIRQYLGHNLPLTELEEEKWFAALAGGDAPSDLVFAIINDGEHVGSLGLHRIRWLEREATFGICIGPIESRKRGLGTQATRLVLAYAFDELDLYRIESRALETNDASIAMHRKLGFVEEGRLRKCDIRGGRRIDCLTFGMLKGELKR